MERNDGNDKSGRAGAGLWTLKPGHFLGAASALLATALGLEEYSLAIFGFAIIFALPVIAYFYLYVEDE